MTWQRKTENQSKTLWRSDEHNEQTASEKQQANPQKEPLKKTGVKSGAIYSIDQSNYRQKDI
jgi:hypothetical protein